MSSGSSSDADLESPRRPDFWEGQDDGETDEHELGTSSPPILDVPGNPPVTMLLAFDFIICSRYVWSQNLLLLL